MTEELTETTTPIICDACGYVAKSPKALAIHRGVRHKELKGVANAAQPSVQGNPEASAPVQAPVQAPVLPVGILDAKLLGITEISEGARLRLNGPHYIFTGNAISGPEVAVNVVVVVNTRWLDQSTSSYYLKGRTESGSQEWILAEQSALTGLGIEILSLKAREVPQDYIPPVPEEVIPENGPSDDEKKEFSEFLTSVTAYAEARALAASAKDAYELVQKEQRDSITRFLAKHGVESDPGKGDERVVFEGWDVLHSFTPGSTIVKKKEQEIAEWLTQNNMFWAFKPVVDWEKWEALKVMGQVPADFIKQVEVPENIPATRRLFVRKLDDK